jgi:hypothetical protein
MMKIITALFVLIMTTVASADVLEVFIWKPIAGKPNAGPDTFQNAIKAKAIQEKHGGEISAARDTMGRLHFAVGFKSWAEWNKAGNALFQDPKNAEFWTAANADPTAEQVEHYLLDVFAPGKGGSVFEVFIWEALPGQISRMFDAGVQAKAIHEKGDVHVSVAGDKLNRMHYIMQYDSWDDYAKLWDTPNEEFSAFMAGQNENPSAMLIKRYTGNELQ